MALDKETALRVWDLMPSHTEDGGGYRLDLVAFAQAIYELSVQDERERCAQFIEQFAGSKRMAESIRKGTT